MTTQNIFFSKSPLNEVIFEIKFSPNMSAACKRDEFYNEIKDLYPEILLPKIDFGRNSFDQPTQYRNREKNKIITCSAQSLSFSTTKYDKFTLFKDETLGLIQKFHTKYSTIDSIKTTGFRYINRIAAEKQENKINLRKYLNFDFSLPPYLSSRNLEFFQTAYFIEIDKQTTGIRVSINSIKDDKNKDFLILDLDLISVREIMFAQLEEYIIDYHAKIENVFLDIISESYKKEIS